MSVIKCFPRGLTSDNVRCVTAIICQLSVAAINQDMIGTNGSVTAISDHPDTVLTRHSPSFQQSRSWVEQGKEEKELRSLSIIFCSATMEQCNNDQYLATLCVVTVLRSRMSRSPGLMGAVPPEWGWDLRAFFFREQASVVEPVCMYTLYGAKDGTPCG